jgi:hypothetical protein
MRKNSEKVPAALGDLVTPMQPAVDLALPKHVRNRQISTLLILIHIYTYYFHIISIFTVSFPFSNIQLQTLFAPWVLRAGPPAKSPGIWTSHGFPHQMASFCTSPNPRRHWLPQPAENWCFNPRNKKTKSRMKLNESKQQKNALMIAGRINGINLCFSSKSDSSLHPRCREAA